MSTAMFSAREAIVPGSAYDRNRLNGSSPANAAGEAFELKNKIIEFFIFYYQLIGFSYQAQDFLRPHDNLTYIDQRHRAFNTAGLPIPVPMFMPSPVYYDGGQMLNKNSN